MGPRAAAADATDTAGWECADWLGWEAHVARMEELEAAAAGLAEALDEAVAEERYSDASDIHARLRAVQAEDPVAVARAELEGAVAEERFGAAAELRDGAALWLLGWWAGRGAGAGWDPYGHVVQVHADAAGRLTGTLVTPLDLLKRTTAAADGATSAAAAPVLWELLVREGREGLERAACTRVPVEQDTPTTSSRLSNSDHLEFRDLELLEPPQMPPRGEAPSDAAGADDDDDGASGRRRAGGAEGIWKMPETDEELRAHVLRLLRAEHPPTEGGSWDGAEAEAYLDDESSFVESAAAGGGYYEAASAQDGSYHGDEDPADAEGGHWERGGTWRGEAGDAFYGERPEALSVGAARRQAVPLSTAGTNAFVLHAPAHPSAEDGVIDERPSHYRRDEEETGSLAAATMRQPRMHMPRSQDGATPPAAPFPVLGGRVEYSRLKDPAGGVSDPLTGLFVGDFGPHGAELLSLSRRLDPDTGKEEVIATKVTGDPNVPAGALSFRADTGAGSDPAAAERYAAMGIPVSRAWEGRGHVASSGYAQASWVPGQLLAFDSSAAELGGASLGFVWDIPGAKRALVALQRVELM